MHAPPDAPCPADTTPHGVYAPDNIDTSRLESLRVLVRDAWKSPLLRLAFIALTLCLLMIPVAMVEHLHRERTAQRDAAAIDISRGWGGPQQLEGPWLALPYSYSSYKEVEDAQGLRQRVREDHCDVRYMMLDQLRISGALDIETRYRGIFNVNVYLAELDILGTTRTRVPSDLPDSANIHWSQAYLLMNLSDVTGIRGPIAFEIDGTRQRAQPLGRRGPASLKIPLALEGPDRQLSVQSHLTFGGTRQLEFVPMAEDFQVELEGAWPTPAFRGQWLPVERTLGDGKFAARWSVPDLARGTASEWSQTRDRAGLESALGVELLPGVDAYRKIERSLKYAGLLIGSTLMMLWLFELRSGRLLRPVQYVVTGAVLGLFFLLELSLSEHIGFSWAYMATALAIATMQADYARGVLGSLRQSLVVWLCHLTVYAGLFMVLSHEDYALLGGSLLVTGMAVVAMRSTRTLAGLRELDD